MRFEVTPKLIERFRNAFKQEKGIRLSPSEAYVVFRALERADAIRDASQDLLDREAGAAAYILTGDWPSLEKYRDEQGAGGANNKAEE